MTPIRVDLSPIEARVLTRGLRVLSKRKLELSDWRAMIRVARKVEDAVDRKRRAAVDRRRAAR